MATASGLPEVLALATVAGFVGVATLGYATASNRWRVRWAVHAAAEVIGPDAVPPLTRPVVDAVTDVLHEMGFVDVVLTRSRRASIRGRPRYWYRMALRHPVAFDGASVEWWDQPARRGGRPEWVSAVWVRMFRFAGRGGYSLIERRAAVAARSDRGRLAYDLVADRVSFAAQHAALADAAGAPGRPIPYVTVPQWVRAIEIDTDQGMAAALARTTRRDRTGRWYVWTWRTAFRNAVRPPRPSSTDSAAGRGFAIVRDRPG